MADSYQITFGYINGKWYSFPTVSSARQAVQKYSGNMESLTTTRPTGVVIDTTLGWNADGSFVDINAWPESVLAPEGVTGDLLINPPGNPVIISPVVDETVDDTGGDTGGGTSSTLVDDEEMTYTDPWLDLDQDLLNLSKRYADAGMMGRAKKAFEQAGGTWDASSRQRMIGEREEVGVYGGTFDFDWANKGITNTTDLEKIKAWAKEGKFGRIKQFMESKKKGSFDKDTHVKLKAFTHRGKHDYVPPSKVEKPDPTVYDPAAFKGPMKDLKGTFKTGQKRQHAKTWRQKHMDAAKKKHGVGDANQTEAQKKAWIKHRNKIASRHRKLIGAEKKTLKSGVVIG